MTCGPIVSAALHSAPLIEVVFRNTLKAFADPTIVTFAFDDPFGVHTVWTYGIDPEVVKDSVGHYHVNLPMSDPGKFPWEWVGSGNDVDSADSGILCARQSVFA